MAKLSLLLSALLASPLNVKGIVRDELANPWDTYKLTHNRSYNDQQVDEFRRAIFMQNYHEIDRLNGHNPKRTFSLTINKFSDRTRIELSQLYGLRVPTSDLPRNSDKAEAFLNNILNNTSNVPDELDWRRVKPLRVTGVKDQGSCGSCWAFATTGVLEGQEFLMAKNNNGSQLIKLSEQNLLDCDPVDSGCEGGFMWDTLNFISIQGGIDDGLSYPYEAAARPCRFKLDNVVITDRGAVLLPIADEKKLKEVVATFGPVAVGIDASSLDFLNYHRGIYVSEQCKSGVIFINHAALVVGYGTDTKLALDYWIVKNSWGADWGHHGYIRMARNKNNMCGIATMATIPTI